MGKGKKSLKNKKTINLHGVSFTENEKKKLRSLVNSVNAKRKRIMTNEKNKDLRTALGVDADFIFGVHSEKNLWGSGADTLLTKNRSASLKQFKSKDEYRNFVKELKKLTNRDYIDTRMKQYQKNQLLALKSVFGNEVKEMVRGLKQLTPKEFIKVRAKFDLPSISFVYSEDDFESKLEQFKSSYERINNEFKLDERVKQKRKKQ